MQAATWQSPELLQQQVSREVCCVALQVHGHKLTQFDFGAAAAIAGGFPEPFGSWEPPDSSTSSRATHKTEYGCPRDTIFDDPWVQANIAVTYGLKIRDGLGSQTARMLGVYAIAAALGIQYYHSPFECIGHIGGVPHWRNMHCDHLPPSDLHKLTRIAKHIHLPSTTTANASSWDSQYVFRGDWAKLASIAAAAKQSSKPMLVKLELVDEFISVCPDIFYHVPAWRPKYTPSQRVRQTHLVPVHQLVQGGMPALCTLTLTQRLCIHGGGGIVQSSCMWVCLCMFKCCIQGCWQCTMCGWCRQAAYQHMLAGWPCRP